MYLSFIASLVGQPGGFARPGGFGQPGGFGFGGPFLGLQAGVGGVVS